MDDSEQVTSNQEVREKMSVRSGEVYCSIVLTLLGATSFSIGSSAVTYLTIINARNPNGACSAHQWTVNTSRAEHPENGTAFSAFRPRLKAFTNSNAISFTDMKLNLGDNFNPANGTFICKSEGIYVFFITFGKQGSKQHNKDRKPHGTNPEMRLADRACCNATQQFDRDLEARESLSERNIVDVVCCNATHQRDTEHEAHRNQSELNIVDDVCCNATHEQDEEHKAHENQLKFNVVDDVCCNLWKSGQPVVHIKVDPTDDGTDSGSTAVTQTVLLQLSVWDTVYLTPCDTNQHLEDWSSFSGYMLYRNS